jgi:hypothetical protein
MESSEAPLIANTKKAKRNPLMSIERRLKSGMYNKKNLKRNLRTLRAKIKEYNKKGELKQFLQTRYNTTRGLLEELEKFEEVGTAIPPPKEKIQKTMKSRRLQEALKFAAEQAEEEEVAPEAAVEEVAPEAAVEEVAPEAAVAHKPPRIMTLKKRNKKPVEFNPPPPEPPPLAVPYGKYNENRSGNFQIEGHVSHVRNNGVVRNPKNFGYVFKEKNKNPKALKLTKPLTEEEGPYLERVYKKYLPLPELYNPFTGEKYSPENDPQPNIDSAHQMLQQILEKAKRNARKLKRHEEKGANV